VRTMRHCCRCLVCRCMLQASPCRKLVPCSETEKDSDASSRDPCQEVGREEQPSLRPSARFRANVSAGEGWLMGVSCICAALLSSRLLAGWGTTVKDAFTAPPEVTLVAVVVCCLSGLRMHLGSLERRIRTGLAMVNWPQIE